MGERFLGLEGPHPPLSQDPLYSVGKLRFQVAHSLPLSGFLRALCTLVGGKQQEQRSPLGSCWARSLVE